MFRIRKTQIHFIFLLSSAAQSAQTEEFMWLIDKLNIKLDLKPSLETNQAFLVLFVRTIKYCGLTIYMSLIKIVPIQIKVSIIKSD